MDNQNEKILVSNTWYDLKTGSKNDEPVVDFKPLSTGEYVIKIKRDPGVDKKRKVEKTAPTFKCFCSITK